MPHFDDLRPFLVAVSKLSGTDYRDVTGVDLDAELRSKGHEHSVAGFVNIMHALKDGDLLTCAGGGFGGPSAYELIRLTSKGRELVEGWPTSAGISTADLAALIDVFRAASDDPDVPEADQTKLRKVAEYLKDVPASVATGVLTVWAQSVTG
jgi:hypothetical protein